MENVKRFIFIASLLAISVIVMHRSKAPQKLATDVKAVCFPLRLAQQLDTNTALKWKAQITYDTQEDDNSVPSYRCYISFPRTDVVCTPRDQQERENLHKCPTFPSLLGKNRKCYFLNSEHFGLMRQLQQTQQRLRMQDLNGIVVKTIDEARRKLFRSEQPK